MSIDEIIIYAVLLGSVFVFGGAAVLTLSWAVRNGQFENLERGARSIFDPGEPIGELTDRFSEAVDQNESAPASNDESGAYGPRSHALRGNAVFDPGTPGRRDRPESK